MCFHLAAQKPTNDQDIFVPENITLIIDYPLPRIHTLKISGQVIFQDVCSFLTKISLHPTHSLHVLGSQSHYVCR